jgi:hypothetical protein
MTGGHPIQPLSLTFLLVANFLTVSKSPFLQALHNRDKGNSQVLLAVKLENKFIVVNINIVFVKGK